MLLEHSPNTVSTEKEHSALTDSLATKTTIGTAKVGNTVSFMLLIPENDMEIM